MRYTVEYQDAAEVVALAKSEGWQDGDSYYDFVDPIADCINASVHKTLTAAKVRADHIARTGKAMSGWIAIEEQYLETEPTDDQGNVVDGVTPEWETSRRWIFQDGKLHDAD